MNHSLINKTGRGRAALFTVSLILLFAGNLFAQGNRLFHIERSKNKNLVCYDVNLANGVLNAKEPITVYWLNQEDKPGQTNGLSAIEKRFAYGYKVVSKGEDTCEVTLSAYSDRKLTIRKLNGKYISLITIDNQPAILQKLYVQAKGKNALTVEYVELFGITLDSGKAVSEKVSQ
ncbi:DUF4833 domain-containing protein [Parabacteroides sp. OttesenSCG-928-G21]|nr:DUF4833 domain-containing protein [Parabacteroides sp. OttesenSCG-928-G21]